MCLSFSLEIILFLSLLSLADVGLRWGKMKPRTSITCRNVWLYVVVAPCTWDAIHRQRMEWNGMQVHRQNPFYKNAPCTTTRYFLFLWLSLATYLLSSFIFYFYFFFFIYIDTQPMILPFRFIFYINKYKCMYGMVMCAYIFCVLQVANENFQWNKFTCSYSVEQKILKRMANFIATDIKENKILLFC